MKTKIVPSQEITDDIRLQIIKMLSDSWSQPQQVYNYWLKRIDYFLLIVENEKVLALGSWSFHKIKTVPYDLGVLLALYAVSQSAQGRGLGTKITLLSYIYAYKQVLSRYKKKRVIFWGTSVNPIVIYSYLKHFSFYITPPLDGTYNKSYVPLSNELKEILGSTSTHENPHPFLLKEFVKLSFTEKECLIQEAYIQKMGDHLKVNLDIRNGDRLILILADLSSRYDLLKLYCIHYLLELRSFFKA